MLRVTLFAGLMLLAGCQNPTGAKRDNVQDIWCPLSPATQSLLRIVVQSSATCRNGRLQTLNAPTDIDRRGLDMVWCTLTPTRRELIRQAVLTDVQCGRSGGGWSDY